VPIRDWPETERPREKLCRHGAGALSDAELLAIMLGSGRRGVSALELARDMLAAFGGLRPLLEASRGELCRCQGVGTARYVQLQAALELSRRFLESAVRRSDVITSPADTRRFVLARLRGHRREVFACLFLDNRHRVIEFEELFFGTVDSASVYPRELVRRALQHNAAAVILAHNHPSGVAEPSQADAAITRRIADALALVDVRVLDHLVVGDTETVSLAERGLM